MPTTFQISTDPSDKISGEGVASSERQPFQRRVTLTVGDTTIRVLCYGELETRQLMKALASASGGLLATLPDESGPLGERDESALLAAVQGDHVGEGVADDGA